MEIPKELKNDIWDYCRANNITNIDEFTLKCLKQGFSVERYGATPVTKVIEKEVEKIVEVPVEKIVEVVREVPVNMVDTEMAENIKKQNDLIDQLKKDLLNAVNASDVLRKQLEEEKKKNKKDIYGES